jgi:predicted dehydrogenase
LIQTFGNYQPNGHTGVDFPVAVGTPVKAVANGTVRHVGWYSGSYADNPYWIAPAFAGFCLVIDHGSFVGIYAHLSGSNMIVGQTVREGQVVASSGNTGGSTGPHLHFEVLPDGWDFNNGMYGRVNPARYITTGGAAIAPQSSTTTPKAEGFLMALTDKQQDELYTRVIRYLEAPVSAIPEKVWQQTVIRGGQKISVKQELADAKSEAQALRAAVVALAKNPSLTADQITAAVKTGLAESVVSVDVNVNGKDAA